MLAREAAHQALNHFASDAASAKLRICPHVNQICVADGVRKSAELSPQRPRLTRRSRPPGLFSNERRGIVKLRRGWQSTRMTDRSVSYHPVVIDGPPEQAA